MKTQRLQGLAWILSTVGLLFGAFVSQTSIVVTIGHVTVVLANARTHLGDLAYELAWSKSTMMTTEQAIAVALS